MFRVLVLSSLLLLMFAPTSDAQVAARFSYQGYLSVEGVPVDEPATTITFRLHADPVDTSNPIWTESLTGVPVVDGRFAVILGTDQTIDPGLFDETLWLEIEYSGQRLEPLTEITASPYAHNLVLPMIQETDVVGTAMTINHIGSFGTAILGESVADAGRGVVGRASHPTSANVGVEGTSASSVGTGVYGLATSTESTESFGVRGESLAGRGIGVEGIGGRLGVRGESTTGTGVRGEAELSGVQGLAVSTTGDAIGVRGQTNSTAGTGVLGVAPTAGTGIGVSGQGSTGVAGIGTAVGLYAEGDRAIEAMTTNPTQPAMRVYREGFAGTGPGGSEIATFFGSVSISGDLNASGVKNFRIDHPFDPANRYLVHTAIESHEILNQYSGTATTNHEGYVQIELPEWFEAINTDFRYQLTRIGAFAQAIIAEEVEDNRFAIRTDQPGVKVSREITAQRNDAATRMRDHDVEPFKPAAERGTYLAPEAFGQTRAEAASAQEAGR